MYPAVPVEASETLRDSEVGQLLIKFLQSSVSFAHLLVVNVLYLCLHTMGAHNNQFFLFMFENMSLIDTVAKKAQRK